MKASVLFVCLGNICRSPTAEGVFRAKVKAHPLLKNNDLTIDSAGTAAWHVGKQPDTRAQAATKKRGYELSSISARQVTDSDFNRFDYILAMDLDNLNHLTEMASTLGYKGHLGLLLDLLDAPIREVPDPYYGGEEGFDNVLDLVESASDKLIEKIAQHCN